MQTQDLATRIGTLTPSQQRFLSETPAHRDLPPGALAVKIGLSASTIRRWRRQEPFKSIYRSLLEAQSSYPLIAIERAKQSSWNLTEKLIAVGLETDINLPANKLGHALAATDRVLKLGGLLKDAPTVAISFETAILQALATDPEAKPYWQS